MGLSGFNYSRQTQPQGFGPQWWSLLGKKIISQQHCTLFLRKEAPQKRNNLLEFLWFGKISCTCSQLLEESQSEIFQGLPAAYNCTSSCISRDAQRLLRAWTGLRTVVQAQVSSALSSYPMSSFPHHTQAKRKSGSPAKQSWQLFCLQVPAEGHKNQNVFLMQPSQAA